LASGSVAEAVAIWVLAAVLSTMVKVLSLGYEGCESLISVIVIVIVYTYSTDTFTFSLENDTGDFFKIIDDTKLRLVKPINYEKYKTKSVDVRVTDDAGHEYVETWLNSPGAPSRKS
jgi:hypothetical protein